MFVPAAAAATVRMVFFLYDGVKMRLDLAFNGVDVYAPELGLFFFFRFIKA
jgi:hypothetical protein